MGNRKGEGGGNITYACLFEKGEGVARAVAARVRRVSVEGMLYAR